MEKKYIVPVIILLSLGVWFVFMPEVDNSKKEMSPEQLLTKLNETSRFYSSDKIANLIINKDPGFLLIDVRPNEEYKEYSLPGAINIPLDSLLNPENEVFINQSQRNTIFFSNDEIKAETAWILCTRLQYKNNYVLSGGLNNWFETIINPSQPKQIEDNEAMALYRSRVAASMFFTGSSSSLPTVNSKPVTFVKSSPNKQRAEGGC